MSRFRDAFVFFDSILLKINDFTYFYHTYIGYYLAFAVNFRSFSIRKRRKPTTQKIYPAIFFFCLSENDNSSIRSLDFIHSVRRKKTT